MRKPNDIEARVIEAIINECELGTADNEPFCTGEIEVGGLLVTVRGHYWTDGYCEDDYYNGTGAWVGTDASVSIDEIEAYDINDEDCNEVALDIDENLVCSAVEEELKF